MKPVLEINEDGSYLIKPIHVDDEPCYTIKQFCFLMDIDKGRVYQLTRGVKTDHKLITKSIPGFSDYLIPVSELQFYKTVEEDTAS